MKVILQSPDVKTSKRLEKFVDQQVSKLDRLYQPIIESRVCLKTDNADDNQNKICELQIVIAGNDLFAAKRATTFEESVSKAIDAVKHQMEKLKTAREERRLS
jgi:putative sigma-54 modulation protein